MDIAKSALILSDIPTAHPELTEIYENSGFASVHLGFTTLTDKRLPDTAPACIILILKQYHVDFKSILKRLRTKYTGATIPVLALVDSIPPFKVDCFDSVLLQPCHPQQVVHRTSALIRLSAMEREIGLRLDTLQEDFGIKSDAPIQNDQEQLSILFIGKASPEFMVIINALQRKNVQIIAAFTSFTAFDYLYEKTFDAVVMNGLESTEPAFTVAETMRKNAKLYNVPAMLLVNGSLFTDHDTAYEKGISDIINAGSELDEIRARLMEQANFHRTHENLKNSFGNLGNENCIDMGTELYNSAFFNAHLKRICEFDDIRGLPTSICLIRVKYDNPDLDERSLAGAYKQVGSMLKNLLRMQDVTARLDTNLFAIAFPGQSAEELQPVKDRIESILNCATLNDPKTGAPLTIRLEVSLNTLDETDRSHSAA